MKLSKLKLHNTTGNFASDLLNFAQLHYVEVNNRFVVLWNDFIEFCYDVHNELNFLHSRTKIFAYFKALIWLRALYIDGIRRCARKHVVRRYTTVMT